MTGRARILGRLALLAWLAAWARAETEAAEGPKLDYLFPAGGQIGTTIKVAAGGKLEPWPVQAWCPEPRIQIAAATNNGQFTFRLAPDLPPGAYPIRFYTPNGATTARAFVAGRIPETRENEPNNNWSQAEKIERLPVTINGRLEKGGDVDCFAVRLEAGRTLVAKVDGYGLGSPIDPFLHLLDAEGNTLAFAHDSANADPILAWKSEKTGVYIVTIAAFAFPPASEVRYAGSPSSVYRLTLTDGPYVERAFPAGGRNGRKTPLELLGWNLESASGELDLTGATSGSDEISFLTAGTGPPLRLFRSDDPEVFEREQNNTPKQAMKIEPPCVLNGRIDPAGDIDWFSFPAKKGEVFEIKARAINKGFPMTPSIAVANQEGNIQTSADQSDNEWQDTALSWSAPSDGDYLIRVTDLDRRGGSNFIYRLEVRRAAPNIRAELDAISCTVEAGKSNTITASLAREFGQSGKLTARIDGLPSGVTLKPGDSPEGNGDWKITIAAAEDAKPFSGPIRVIFSSSETNAPISRAARFILREKEPYGDLLINETEDMWLTVTPKSPPEEKKEEKKK